MGGLRVGPLVAITILACVANAAAGDGAKVDPWQKEKKAKAEELGFMLQPDTAPRPEFRPRGPKYPEEASRNCITGVVVVVFGINADGDVVSPEVVQSVPGLDSEALEHVKKWHFKPTENGGARVGTVAVMPMMWSSGTDRHGRALIGPEADCKPQTKK